MRALRYCSGVLALLAVAGTIALAPGGAGAGTITVTPVSGGSAISADSAASGGTGAFAALTGPDLAEGSPGDIQPGTIVLSVPAGFELQPGQGGCAVTLGNAAASFALTTATTATCTVTAASTVAGRIAFSGLKVRPLAGVPLASGTVGLGGTAAPSGAPAGAGSLAEVAGAATRLAITGPASTGSGDSTAITVTAFDRFGSRATGYAGSKSLTFSGARSISFPGHPDIVNVPSVHGDPTHGAEFDSPVAFPFVAGQATKGSVGLPRAEVTRICATDGTIAAAGTGCLTISVAMGPISIFTATELVSTGRGRFAVQPVLAQSDNAGNILTTPSLIVASIRPGNAAAAATGATLTGTTSIVSSGGFTTFSDLGLDRSGSGFQLQFTAYTWCSIVFTGGPCHVNYSLPFTVPDAAASATELSSSSALVQVGAAVTLTAVVAGIPGFPPTGGVTFRDGGAVLGTGTLIGGTAVLTTAALAAGTHALTAEYSGDGTYGASTSAAISQVVAAPATPGTVTVTPATGGAAISADTAAIGGSGTYTVLAGPELAEAVAGNLAVGTVVVAPPAGFAFQPGSGSCGTTQGDLVAAMATVTAGAATCSIAAPSTVPARLAFTGLAVRPIVGAPLAAGALALSGSAGVAIGSASPGALAVVPGQAARLAVVGGGTLQAGESAPFSIVAYDAFANVATGYAGSTAVTFTGALPVAVPGHPEIGSEPAVRRLAQVAGMGAPLVLPFAGGQVTGTSVTLVRVGVNVLCAAAGAIAATGDDCLVAEVEPAPAIVRVTRQPVATARGTLAVQPEVVVADGYGNVLPGPATVTAVLRPGNAAAAASGASLTGTASATAVDGIATFSGLGLDRSATGFQLAFTGTGYCGAGPASIGACAEGTSDPFDVPGAGALAVGSVTAPGTAVGGRYRLPLVGLLRDDRSPETSPAVDAPVTLTITPASGPSRQATVRTSSGTAAFATLTIDSSAAPVVVRAADGAGHIAQVGSRDPVVTAAPPASSPSQDAAVAWTAIAVIRSECSFDGGPYAACSSPRTYHGLAAGAHALCIRAVGGSATACRSWTVVGAGPPVPSITAITVSGRSATAVFAASQPGSRLTCSLDSGAYRTCSSPLVFNGLAAGSHQLRVLAVNFAGQSAVAPATGSFTIG